jgi:hypothetical protein
MGTVGREILYWQDAPGTLQIGIDPGVEYTGLAFVSWPYGRIGTVLRPNMLRVLHDFLGAWAEWSRGMDGTHVLWLKLAYEEPGPSTSYTWEQLGYIKGIIDGWAWVRPEVTVIDDRPVRAQQVKSRMAQVPLLLDALEPLEVTHEGLSERLPIHAREALATLIR